MKRHQEIDNFLIRQNVEHLILKRKNVRDSMADLEAQSALIEMLFKTKQSTNVEAVEFWESRLDKVSKVLDLVTMYKEELAKVEMAYDKLYSEYRKVTTLVNKLEEEF